MTPHYNSTCSVALLLPSPVSIWDHYVFLAFCRLLSNAFTGHTNFVEQTDSTGMLFETRGISDYLRYSAAASAVSSLYCCCCCSPPDSFCCCCIYRDQSTCGLNFIFIKSSQRALLTRLAVNSAILSCLCVLCSLRCEIHSLFRHLHAFSRGWCYHALHFSDLQRDKNSEIIKEQLPAVAPSLEQLWKQKDKRIKEFSDSDLSPKKLKESRAQLQQLQKGKSERLKKVLESVTTVHDLCAVRKIDFFSVMTEVHPSLTILLACNLKALAMTLYLGKKSWPCKRISNKGCIR
ncbi:hypothetical protein ACET3Z_028361 [Daucus carota]